MNNSQISVQLFQSEHNSWVDIEIPTVQVSGHSTLTLMNALGEQIQQFFCHWPEAPHRHYRVEVSDIKS